MDYLAYGEWAIKKGRLVIPGGRPVIREFNQRGHTCPANLAVGERKTQVCCQLVNLANESASYATSLHNHMLYAKLVMPQALCGIS